MSRQWRYEALLRWQAPTIISSIPGLLEVALVLFLTGLVILLWTLNGVVAGVCTAVVSIVVLLTVATTILPAIIPECPYKTPLGWASLSVGKTLARFGRWLVSRLHHTLTYLLSGIDGTAETSLRRSISRNGNAQRSQKVQKYKDWRSRDRESQIPPSTEVLDYEDLILAIQTEKKKSAYRRLRQESRTSLESKGLPSYSSDYICRLTMHLPHPGPDVPLVETGPLDAT